MTDNQQSLQFSARANPEFEGLLDHISKQLEASKIKPCFYQLGERYGHGTIEGFILAPGLEVIRWKTDLRKPFTIKRPSESGLPMWSILLTSSHSFQAVDTINVETKIASSAYVYNSKVDVDLFGTNEGPLSMILIRLHPQFWEDVPAQAMKKTAQLFDNNAMFKAFTLGETLSLQFHHLLDKKNELFLNDWHSQITVLTICNHVFTQLAQRGKTPNLKSREINLLHQGATLMLANLKRPLSIEKICEHIGMGRDKFRRLFKQVYDVTPYQYFQHHRMLKAQSLIRQGLCSVTQAGYEIGYNHLGHFASAYKKQFGMLPKDSLKAQ